MAGPRKLEQARDWALLAVVLVTTVVMIYFALGFERVGEAEATQVASAPKAAVATEMPTAEVFVIKMPPRDGNRLNSKGVMEPGNTEAFRDQIAEQARRDPLTLFAYYMASPLGEKRPLKNEAVIAKDGVIKDGNTYSEEGVKAYNDWLLLWELADIEAVREIRFQGANTGVKGTRLTHSVGVGGKDKSGFNIAYRDVSGRVTHQHSVLCRCTQPTFGEPIRWAPEGPTDCPPRPKGPNPQPDIIRRHQDSVPLPPRTTGYVPDNAERVREQQESQPIGGTTPTPSGTPGRDSEGITPPGESHLPDGVSSPTPPPQDEPPGMAPGDNTGTLPKLD